MRGDLAALYTSRGSFASSLVLCVDDDGGDARADDPLVPAAGGGSFLLVRPIAPPGVPGSSDEGGDGQAGPRAAVIGASPDSGP